MSSSANWTLRVREKVYKELSKFPRDDQERIINVIENHLPSNPYMGDVEKMKGEETVWRRRVGNYRIFYEIIAKEKGIYVFRIERRTSSTH